MTLDGNASIETSNELNIYDIFLFSNKQKLIKQSARVWCSMTIHQVYIKGIYIINISRISSRMILVSKVASG